MQLVGYQDKHFNKLYNELVENEAPLIFFTGYQGCGKSTIIQNLAEKLKETWEVFLLKGMGKTSPPYSSWYTEAQTSSLIPNISVGVKIQPEGWPINFGLDIKGISKELFLNNNEQNIRKAISKKANSSNILFLVDDYNSWDQASKELLIKIVNHRDSILGKSKKVHVILIDTEIDKLESLTNLFSNSGLKVHIDDIPHKDIIDIINHIFNITTSEKHDFDRIIQFTSYDLDLIQMAVQYESIYGNDEQISTLRTLFEQRISHMADCQKQVCQTLEYVSIINSPFTAKEAAHLLNKEPMNAEDDLYKAFELDFLQKEHAYNFSNKEIQQYFEDQLKNRKKHLHHKFSEYLQKYHPENYLNRAHHIFQSHDVGNVSNGEDAKNSAYYIAIDMVRRMEIMGDIKEVFIEKLLNEKIDSLPSLVKQKIKSNISSYHRGSFLIRLGEYKNAISVLWKIEHSFSSEVFRIEVMRQRLLSLIQIADDSSSIKETADEIYDHITNSGFDEDEIWCKAALLLFGVYRDRHIDIDKFKILQSGFESRMNKYMSRAVFISMNIKYCSKASLFYPTLIAVERTEISNEHYRNNNDPLNLYFSLCNNAGNRIVCGQYTDAELRLLECEDIIQNNPEIKFPSLYKIHNNKIINQFLQSEGYLYDHSSRDRDMIILAAKNSIAELKNLIKTQGEETSYVIKFNLLSMFMLCNKTEQIDEMLLKFEQNYNNLDVFYQYYFQSACCSKNILIGKYSKASYHLEILKNLYVPLLATSFKIFDRRNQVLQELITEQFSGDAFNFNYEFIKRGMKKYDAPSSFWGRGFLLSDLQFLSF